MLAAALFGSTPADAQCAPDPTRDNGTTVCTGIDADGLDVPTNYTNIVVNADAVVMPGTGAGAIVTSGLSYLDVAGRIDGGGVSGVFITNGAPFVVPCDPYAYAGVHVCTGPGNLDTIYPSGQLAITVKSGGTIAGASGVRLSLRSDNTSAVTASVDNAGTITAASGPALIAETGTSFSTIRNRRSGTIEGISGAVASIDNAGALTGGVTIAGASYVINSGRITASGDALTTTDTLNLVNTGRITSSGGAAIRTGGSLTLTNSGTITGDVLSAAAGQANVLDIRAGTVRGAIGLGAGDDLVIARLDLATGQIAGVSGTVDAGGGTDTIQFDVTRDSSFASAALPPSFERLGINDIGGMTVTLAPGFNVAGGVVFTGVGTLDNRADLTTNGTAITAMRTDYSTTLTVRNEGTISAMLTDASQAAVAVGGSMINDGTIVAIGGNGVGTSAYGVTGLTNNGRITATGVAANFRGLGDIVNTGLIESTAGTGLILGYGTDSSNAGTISGATIGAAISFSHLTNSGVIVGNQSGVSLEYSSTLDNLAGGTITGNGIAIGGGSQSIVSNAGTVNGDVDFTLAANAGGSADVFTDKGGIVNGAIRLGGGDDRLVTDLGRVGPLAGASGGVDAGYGYDTIEYRVATSMTTTAEPPATFDAIAYDLADGVALSLSVPVPVVASLAFSGIGTVDLSADIATTGRTLVTLSSSFGSASGIDETLALTSRGALSVAANPNNPGNFAAAIYAGNAYASADITNAGSIVATGGAYGIYGGSTVANSGTITVTDAAAVSAASHLINSGTIVSPAGSAGGGISGVLTIENSGTIQTDGLAITGSYFEGAITSSGLIESRTTTALQINYGIGTTIVNDTGGTIRGVGAAIVADSGTVVNRGTIIGDLQFSGDPYGSGTYVADGGTLTGNVAFGNGNDAFIQTGASTGVSGTIDGGEGANTFGFRLSSSGTVLLDTGNAKNFEGFFVQSQGADTVVTLTAPTRLDSDIVLDGDGGIVNLVGTTGRVLTSDDPLAYLPVPSSGSPLVSFDNRATIGSFRGSPHAFLNSGTIGNPDLTYFAALVSTAGDLHFVNDGTIASAGSFGGTYVNTSEAHSFSVANGGTIRGGLQAAVGFADGNGPNTATVVNTGSIDTLQTTVTGAGTLDFSNSGIIDTSAGTAGSNAVNLVLGSYSYGTVTPIGFTARNSGSILANQGGATITIEDYGIVSTNVAVGLFVGGDNETVGTVSNLAGGTIAATGPLSIAVITSGAALTLDNAGTIVGTKGSTLSADDTLAQQIGDTFVAGAIQTIGDASDTIHNTGTITGSIDLGAGDDRIDNYGTITGDVRLGAGNDSFFQYAGAVMDGSVDGGDGIDSFTIDATGGGTIDASRVTNFEQFGQTGAGSVGYSGAFAQDTIRLDDTIATVAKGASVSTSGPITFTGSDGREQVRNDGAIAGGIDLGAGSDAVVNAGTIGGAVALGDGDDSFTEGAGSSVAGGVDGGAGNDSYLVALTGDRSGIGARSGFEQLGVIGAGTLSLTLDQDWQAIGLAGTGLNLALAGHAVGAIAGGDGSETLAIDGDVPAVTLAGGDDALTLAGANFAGRYDGGSGSDLLRFTNPGPVTVAGSVSGFETLTLDGGALAVAGTLGTANDRTSTGAGAQSIALQAGGTIAGALDLGDGDDTLTIAAGGTLSGRVSGGAGSDLAVLELTPDLALDGDRLQQFEALRTTGTGALRIASGTAAFDTVAFGGSGLTIDAGATLRAGTLSFGDAADALTVAGTFAGAADLGGGDDVLTIAAGGTLTGSVSGGAGSDRVVLALAPDFALDGATLQQFETLQTTGMGALRIANGTARFDTVTFGGTDLTIDQGAALRVGTLTTGNAANRLTIAGDFTGNADLGGGDDLLRLTGIGTLAGSVEGGAGNDRIELATGGSDAAPVALGMTPLTGFETLAVQSGVVSMAGSYRFDAIEITGGRLIGLAGSVFTAPRIAVAAGATFGSAGRVVGDIAVAGTLSPGASPGTMTVIGNVALARGSNTLFELTPTISDQLLVSGTIDIASGATLTLTGTRPLTPGTTLTLIQADGGITGSFTTIAQPTTIAGFVRQSGTRIDLMSTFAGGGGFSGQANAAIDYVNAVLTSGQASTALIAAVPSLLTAGGTTNDTAFRRVTPEAYASASQIGTENGLTVIEAARGQARTHVSAPGLFTFGQGLFNNRTIEGGATQGTATARTRTWGGMGGVGFGTGNGWFGAFVGYLDGHQDTGVLAARTEAHGVFGGVQGGLALGALDLAGVVAYDGGHAAITRDVPGGATARGRFGLHSWIGDLSVRYTLPMGEGWAIQPRAGASYVHTTRGRVTETGGGAFALAVTRDRTDRWFLDGDIAIAGGRGANDRLHPYVSGGVRGQIDGRGSAATGGFVGVPVAFTVPGVSRGRTVATAGAGVSLDVTPRVSVFGSYAGEYGNGDRHDAQVGLRIRM